MANSHRQAGTMALLCVLLLTQFGVLWKVTRSSCTSVPSLVSPKSEDSVARVTGNVSTNDGTTLNFVNFTNDTHSTSSPNVPRDQRFTTITILRTIGNPLPSRHDANQAVRNLRFTLRHEADFPNSQTHWVLNRLVDADLEASLIKILTSYKKNFTVIPFDLRTYDSIPYLYNYYLPYGNDTIHRKEFVYGESNKIKNTLERTIQHDKILYVVNANGARNAMIDIGRNEYNNDWILPWDGNCFLTRVAFDQLYRQLYQLQWNTTTIVNSTTSDDFTAEDEGKRISNLYAIAPMTRLQKFNREVLSPKYTPLNFEEQQIILHRSAKGRFNPRLRYGYRNKVEFLHRLGIQTRPVMKWPLFEQQLMQITNTVQDLNRTSTVVSKAGWVVRLTSGRKLLKKKPHKSAAASVSAFNLLLSRLDVRAVIEIYGFHPNKLLFYDENALQRDRYLYVNAKNHPIQATVRSLIDLANEAITKVVLASPVSLTVDQEMADQVSFSYAASNVTTLALAYYMTGHKEYGRHAADLVKIWILNNKMTRRLYLESADDDSHSEKIDRAILSMRALFFMLDGLRMLQGGKEQIFSRKDEMDLFQWFDDYFVMWDVSSSSPSSPSSPWGKVAYTNKDLTGLTYDLLMTSNGAFTNRTDRMIWYLDRSVSRLAAHIERYENENLAGNRDLSKLSHTSCDQQHEQFLMLQTWTNLARIGSSLGRPMWDKYHVYGQNTSALCRLALIAVTHFGERISSSAALTEPSRLSSPLPLRPCASVDDYDARHWMPIWYTLRQYCPVEFHNATKLPPRSTVRDDQREGAQSMNRDGLSLLSSGGITPFSMPHVFHVKYGIPPFWTLGMAG